MGKSIHIIFSKLGFSLIEILVATVILLASFLGMISLSASLLKSNAEATNLNIATEIASMQVAQLNCIGAANLILGAPYGFGSILPTVASPYTYTVSPTITSPDNRSHVTTCINPVLTYGSPIPPSNLSTNNGLAITTSYVVKLSFTPGPQPGQENATVTVSWNNGQNSVTLYDIVSNFI